MTLRSGINDSGSSEFTIYDRDHKNKNLSDVKNPADVNKM